MLRYLAVRHLAVIDELALEFDPGLNVLTGETGAGKSILVGAVGLLVGGRASADLVRTGEEVATVEAVFEAQGRDIILRREITAQGRSRGYIDGVLASVAALRDVSAPLVDLHGQHEHQVLLDPVGHLDLLDEFAGARALRDSTAKAFSAWQQAKQEYERVQASCRDAAARAEFVAFQLAEIDRVAPRPDEDDELSALRLVLANADKVRRLCAEAYQQLYEGDQAALPALGVVWRKIGELSAIDERFAPHLAARDAVKAQLEELAYFLRSYAAGIDESPARLQEVEDRLALLERLKKKHGPALADVVARADQLRRELHGAEHASEQVAELERALEAARAHYVSAANALSAHRHAAAQPFSRALERSVGELAMPRTRCAVRFVAATSEADWSARGTERGEFFISPNPGEDLRPLARIVSGGELSRIMLALKTLASIDAAGKTLIFDEVDSGIGGAVADIVGARLQKLGERFQVLCITHLPQIAAHAGTHFRIRKDIRSGRTVTDVTRLSPPEREEELARMIGGSDVSATVRAGAREMLARRQTSVQVDRPGATQSPRQRMAPARPRKPARKPV